MRRWLLLLFLGSPGLLACGSTSSESSDDAGGKTPPLTDGGVTPGPDGQTSQDSGVVDAGGLADVVVVDASVPETGVPWVTDPASLVNTLFGTTAGGNTFPGADVPFGMIQWSPDTLPNRNEGGGYDYTDTQLIGFSLTHISGPGCGVFGDIPILPMLGTLPAGTSSAPADPSTHLEPLTHTGEIATAGYYSVQSGSAPQTITTEITATLHSAMARFTFPSTTTADLMIKLLDSENGGNSASTATIVGTNEVQGSTTEPNNFCGYTSPYTVYFDIVFDQPFTASQVVQNAANTMPNVVFLTFDTTTTQVVQAKVAISWVSAANANANWTAENPPSQWSFDTVKTSAQAAWNTILGQIQIGGGSASDQQLFYTALYHSLLHPNVFSDVNGQYIGFDKATHTVLAPQKDQYANYSGWDIYHSQVQLSALMAPQQMSDSAQSMVNDATQNGGQLPKWALANAETYVMVGDPADGILAGYYAFGATGFDSKTALTQMLAEADTPNAIRTGLDYYETLGYLPDDGVYTACCVFDGSGTVSTTLEYAAADFALSQFAAANADPGDAARLLARAQNWQNVFDPAPTSQLFNPKLLNGTFVGGIGLTSTDGMVEGSASQYRWIVPFNRQAQLTAMGGPATVNPLLTSFFSNLDDLTGTDALFANEFQLGSQYWNDYTGEPWAAQDVVNRLRTQVFTAAPAFLNNNDDLGAESSLLAWSMLGLYPDYPGSAVLTLNAPEFPEELIHLPSGAKLGIYAPGVSSATPYVQSLLLNGQPSTAPWLPASFVTSGGTLEFTLGSSPNTTWGTSPSDAPPSFGTDSTAAIGFVPLDAPVTLLPGATASATIGAQSTRPDVAQTVTWQVAPGAEDAGVGAAPANGSFSLAAGAQGTAQVTVTAPQATGQYQLPFQLATSLSGPDGGSVACPGPTLGIIVANPITNPSDLSPFFNNAGISSDTTGTGNFDGVGYSYSAQALQALTPSIVPGATFAVAGVTYAWPAVASGQPDNIIVRGQTIIFNNTAPNTTLGLLGAATEGGTSGVSGMGTVTYSDHTTAPIAIAFTDWTENGGGTGGATPVTGNVVAFMTPYRDGGTQKSETATYVFALNVTLANKPVTSITLPASTSGGLIHLFDIEVQ